MIFILTDIGEYHSSFFKFSGLISPKESSWVSWFTHSVCTQTQHCVWIIHCLQHSRSCRELAFVHSTSTLLIIWQCENEDIPWWREAHCVFSLRSFFSSGLYLCQRTFQPLGIALHASACLADVCIAGSLCILLHRARTGFKQYGYDKTF